MQNKSQPFFKNRSVFYLSRSIVEQGESGSDWRYDVKAVYLIAFLNFHLKGMAEEFRTDVALMDMQHKTLFSDKMRMIFLQLPYFTKEIDECNNIFERIIYVLKHMDILQRMPFLAQDAVFKRLSEIAEVGSMTKEERRQYDESLKHYRDTIAVMQGQYLEGMEKGMEKGRAEGMEIGMEKGMEKGIATANRANARRMKADSMSTELIMKYCGLTRQEVEEL